MIETKNKVPSRKYGQENIRQELKAVASLCDTVVSIGRLTAFYVVLVPMEYILSEPPHSAYVIVSFCTGHKKQSNDQWRLLIQISLTFVQITGHLKTKNWKKYDDK